jgi:D-aminopeptidase
MTRLRDLGITVGDLPTGRHNAITDVAGVRVGHTTLISGEGPLRVGHGPVRTGVTVIFPTERQAWEEPVFAGYHRLNGMGEITGLQWIRESGMLTTPIGLTNTDSVGAVRDALAYHEAVRIGAPDPFGSLPVVGETFDYGLNDTHGRHVRDEHVFAAIDAAAGGPVAEGNVGGGTGMQCHGFKGGIGTSSRVVPDEVGGWTVGVLAQTNHGRRERLTINGVPVGKAVPAEEVPVPTWFKRQEGTGSIIVVVATDAPLLPTQCDRLAQRAALGIARLGGVGEHYSGDLVLSFATGNRGLPRVFDLEDDQPHAVDVKMMANHFITPLFDAVVEATEEAILNALVAAETLVGRDGHTLYALEHERLVQVMADANALEVPRR